MSRHKIVRNLDLDDELDDFDGGEDYDAGVGEGEEDAEHMKAGTIKVREALQGDIPDISDKEIQDSLWHYYYDVDKSVNWLRGQHKSQAEKAAKKQQQQEEKSKEQPGKKRASAPVAEQQKRDGGSRHFFAKTCLLAPLKHARKDSPDAGILDHDYSWTSRSFQDSRSPRCKKPFSAAEFFKDCPWLKIPNDRRAEILVESLYPRGGLLGGMSSGTRMGKPSKLAALAAARKKLESEKRAQAHQSVPAANEKESSSASLLEKLSNRRMDHEGPPPAKDSKDTGRKSIIAAQGDPPPSRDQVANEGLLPTQEKTPSPAPSLEDKNQPSALSLQASPSQLAQVMLGTDLDDLRSLNTSHDSAPLTWRDAFRSYDLDSDPFAGPSPDDIVIAAQNSKNTKSGKSSSKQINGEKATDQATNGVASISVEESSRIKSKNIDVLSEYIKTKTKNSANFVVIGHVDHGKSTLMGRLLVDLKVIDTRTMDKFRKESESIGKSSFALAWVLDQTSEERNRGVTMDIATNQFETEKTKFTILDAPGHRDFIPNMIAGASQADFAVLVIDGSPNAFESGLKGQTKEHALLVRSMGVQRIIIAVNKMDLFGWSEDRFREIEQQTLSFLTAAGFQSKNISFIPCSGLTGDNVARKASDKAPWYTGLTLVESLDASEPVSRAVEKPLRITISDIFRGGVMNPLSVSGRLEAGSLQVGDAVIAMPSGERAYIKGIELDQEPRGWTVAGHIATLHLTDIDPIHLKTGDILCHPSSPITPITTFTIKVLAFDHLTPMAVDVHRGRLHAPAQITQLVATLDKSTGQQLKKKPKIVQPGSVARVRVEMAHAVPLEAAERVVLRAGGETVAAGLIE